MAQVVAANAGYSTSSWPPIFGMPLHRFSEGRSPRALRDSVKMDASCEASSSRYRDHQAHQAAKFNDAVDTVTLLPSTHVAPSQPPTGSRSAEQPLVPSTMSLGNWNVTTSFSSSHSTHTQPEVAPTGAMAEFETIASELLLSGRSADPQVVDKAAEEAEGPAFKKVRLSGEPKRGRKPTKKSPDYLPPSKRPGVSHAKKKEPGHVKRPRNAFILFRSHLVAERLIPKEVECDHRNISRIVSEIWNSTPDDERAYWYDLADKEREVHRRLYPDYTYKPETRKSQPRKRNVKQLPNAQEQCKEIANMILTSSGGRLKPSDMDSTTSSPHGSTGGITTPAEAGPSGTRRSAPASRAPKRKSRRQPAKDEAAAVVGMEPVTLRHATYSRDDVSRPPVEAPDLLPITGSVAHTSAVLPTTTTNPSHDHASHTMAALGRRASSVPLVAPGEAALGKDATAPEFFEPVSGFAHGIPGASRSSEVFNGWTDRSQEAELFGPHGGIEGGGSPKRHEESPTKRKPRPPPFQLQRSHFGAFDDQVLPSATADSFFAHQDEKTKIASGRPRTALSSTPNTANMLGEFTHWGMFADPTLVSPMVDLFPRRTSFATAFGSVTSQFQRADSSHVVNESLSNAVLGPLDASELFENASHAALHSLHADGLLTGFEESQTHHHGDDQRGGNSLPAGAHLSVSSDRIDAAVPEPEDEQTFRFSAPETLTEAPMQSSRSRISLSDHSLAAAARDWLSSPSKKSQLEAESTACERSTRSFRYGHNRSISRTSHYHSGIEPRSEQSPARSHFASHVQHQQHQQQHVQHLHQHSHHPQLPALQRSEVPPTTHLAPWTDMPPPSAPPRHSVHGQYAAGSSTSKGMAAHGVDQWAAAKDSHIGSQVRSVGGDLVSDQDSRSSRYTSGFDVSTPVEVTMFDCGMYLGQEPISASVYDDTEAVAEQALDAESSADVSLRDTVVKDHRTSLDQDSYHLTPMQMIMMEFQRQQAQQNLGPPPSLS